MVKKFLTFVALCMAIISNTNAETSASAIASKKQTLFSSVNHSSTPYRIPAVATLNNGTVLAIADQRPCGADVGNGEVDIYAKVGTINADGSYSWNPASIDPSEDGGLKIAEGTSSNGYGDAAVVVDRESGKVLVICVAGKVVFSKGTSYSHNKMARIVGSADGLSWESPQDVTSAFFANELKNAYTMFMASGKMVQSQLVKVGNYYRIYGALLVRDSNSTNYKNYVVYTDDFGANWSVLKGTDNVAIAVSNADEAKVEELPNGDIVLSSRTSGGRKFNVFNFTDLNNATGSWGSSSTVTFAGGNSTNGELKFYKGLVDANGTEYNVMFQSLPIGSSSREKVSVYYKAFATNKTSWSVSDFTSGWTKGIQVDDGASAYSTMTILPNGQVGFLYEDDYDTNKASGDYSNIVYVPLTVEEMTGGAFSLPTPVAETVEMPAFSPAGGEVEEGTTVTIACPTDGATIYYTTDGTEPTTSSTKYTGAITVNSTMTIKAIAVKDGYTDSEVATASYTIKQNIINYPVTPATGNIGDKEYYLATFSATEATVAPAGVKVFYVTANDNDDNITLMQVADGKAIPAGEGVILKASTPDAFKMTSAIEGTPEADFSGNYLKGTLDVANFKFNKENCYALVVKGSGTLAGQFAFSKVNNGTEINGYNNRAYLDLSSSKAFSNNFRLSFGGVTGIEPVVNEESEAVIFDLNGRRVSEMEPGKIYIINGKKVLNK